LKQDSLSDGKANIPFFKRTPIIVSQKATPSSLNLSSNTSLFSLKSKTLKTGNTETEEIFPSKKGSPTSYLTVKPIEKYQKEYRPITIRKAEATPQETD
jgi:hypothetical protein